MRDRIYRQRPFCSPSLPSMKKALFTKLYCLHSILDSLKWQTDGKCFDYNAKWKPGKNTILVSNERHMIGRIFIVNMARILFEMTGTWNENELSDTRLVCSSFK